jgi:putative restriction endonuclease
VTQLTRDALLAKFRALNIWTRGDERAPHKPLLVLLALARLQHGDGRLIAFDTIDEPLRKLLQEFGPARRSYHPEFPFWHLRTDQVWEVPDASSYTMRSGGHNPSRTELLARHARGGFTDDVFRFLTSDPTLVREIAQSLLDQHFPESLHDEVLEQVGLDLGRYALRVVRDPEFRHAVLQAYSRSCAVCGFDGHLSSGPFGLDAAHIKWKQAGGPDEVVNGVAMCVLHHRAFDRGAFTIGLDLCVAISADLTGSRGVREMFFDLHGRAIQPPHAERLAPRGEFLEWHRREMFHDPARGE